MNPTSRPNRRLAAPARLLAVVLLLGPADARPARAGTVEFPAAQPALTLELPAGWSHQVDATGNLLCSPPTPDSYKILVGPISHSEFLTEAQVESVLLVAVHNLPNQYDGMTALEVGAVENFSTPHGLAFRRLRADCRVKGLPAVMTTYIFTPGGERWYTLFTRGSAEADQAHAEDCRVILNSIATPRPAAGGAAPAVAPTERERR